MDPGIAAVAGSAITTLGVVYVAHQNKRQEKKLNKTEKKVDEVHKQTTVNHHSSSDPTILDRLDNIENMVRSHIQWHKDVR